MSLLAELKRRNVIRMAGLYLIGAWLIVQVADTVLPMFGAPEWLPRSLVILLVIGFPPALGFAWVFELTPTGIKRDEEVDRAESIAPRTAQRMNRLIVALLVLAVVYFSVDKFVLAPQREAAEIAHATAKQVSPAAPEMAAVSDKSIAVLPFENLSSDPDNAYFATGMQDEILTRLSKISALKVISRTSTMNIASKPGNLPEIARLLGVSAILEGSVQKAGDTVHINVQLIRAASDEHLWAESYNRKLDDVFAVQVEVAQVVADKLSAALTGAERDAITARSTSNTKAYEFYLRGLAMESRYTSSIGDIEQRVAAYQNAVDLDPQFALAWAGLSAAQSELYFASDQTSARLAAAKQALGRALELAPDATETWVAQGYYRYLGIHDYDGAFAAYSKAREARPNDGLIVYLQGIVRRRQAHWDEALPLLLQATELDPLATNTWFNYGTTLRALRRYDEAQAAFDRGLAAAPGDRELLVEKLRTFLAVGDLAAAEKFVQSLAPDEQAKLKGLPSYLDILRRDYLAVIEPLNELLKQRDTLPPNALSGVLQGLGNAEILSGDRTAGMAHLTEGRELMQKFREQGNESSYLLIPLSKASAALGDRDAAYRQSDEAAKRLANDTIGLPQAIEAQAYARMLGGDKAQAVALLRKMLALPNMNGSTSALLRLDPKWDPLRKTPGFDALLIDNAVPLQTMPEPMGTESGP
jgi:TolB-like protein/Tfp pilus assembly protein PilF